MSTRIQLRRGTAAEWVSANPVLAVGEVGVELQPGVVPDRMKVGDGGTAWTGLPYSFDPSAMVPLTLLGVPDGVATLDSDGIVPAAQLPPVVPGGGEVGTSRLVPVVVITGESNSGGYAENADATATELAPRPETLIFNNTTEVFEPLNIGTNNLIGHSGLGDNATHGFENPLANSVAAGDWVADTVYLIKTGQGASRIDMWDFDDPYWLTFKDRTSTAFALLRAEGLVPVPYVWLSLGINDAIAGTTVAAFKTAFVAWLARVRLEVGYCPIFATELPEPPYDAYNVMLREVDAEDGAFYLAETTDATLRDSNHWDYDGIKLIGDRFVDLSVNRIGEREVYTLQMMQALGGTSVGAAPPEEEPGGGGLVPGIAQWEAVTNTSQVGDFLNLDTPSAPAGGRAVGTIDANADFEVLMEYPNSADSQGLVVFLDDDNTTNYTWNAANVFVAGGYHYSGAYTVAPDGNTPIATSLVSMAFPTDVKMRRSGDDVVFSHSISGAAFVDFHTMAGVLAGKTTLYLKALYAVPSAGQKIKVTVSQ